MPTHKDWFQMTFKLGGSMPRYADNLEIVMCHTDLDTSLTFPQSVRRALELLAQKNKKVIVQYSGGLDSEIIIREACAMGLDVVPYTLRFLNDLNDHEIYYCKLLESELGIEVKYIDLDFEAWMYDPEFEKGYYSYIAKHDIWHLAAPANWYLRDIIADIEGDCVVINGSGDTPLYMKPLKHRVTEYPWQVTYSMDGHWKRMWHSQTYYPDDAPLFFMYIPEIHYSYLTHPLFKHCVKPDSFKLGPSSTRHQLYQEYYPDALPRNKYTGYEKLQLRPDYKPMINVRAYSCAMQAKSIPYEEYIRMLRV